MNFNEKSIPVNIMKNGLEEALEYVKNSGEVGRIYPTGEVGDMLRYLESLGCVKSSEIVKYTYLKELPERL